jgi:hypothetical protein
MIKAQDTFQRSDSADGWGVSSDGKAYVKGGTGTVSIVGNQGRILSPGLDTTMSLLGVVETRIRALVAVTFNSTGDIAGIGARYSLVNDACYKLLFYAGALHLNRRLTTGDNVELAGGPFSMTPGTRYLFCLQTIGSLISAKAWEENTPEPKEWMLQATDTGLSEGGISLIAANGPILFDHLLVTDGNFISSITQHIGKIFNG